MNTERRRAAMIPVTSHIAIDEKELDFSFVRASGPGGQNVNKVATAVQLRFDGRKSPSLSNGVFLRLKSLAGRRMTAAGILIIEAKRFRSQERNREDALSRLIDLVRRAAQPPRRRRKTRVPSSSRKKRMADKRTRADTKRRRAAPGDGED